VKAGVRLRKSGIRCLPVVSLVGSVLFLTAAIGVPAALTAQTTADNPAFARKNTFSVFSAYSNDSSHILMGIADNRRLLDFGVSYGRRLFAGRIVNWQYNGEILPVALNSDPVQVINETTTVKYTNGMPTETLSGSYQEPTLSACRDSTSTRTYPIKNGTVTTVDVDTCSRRWVIGEGMSPAGFQWNFMPRHKMQPFLIGHGGYMYSTQPIPVENAGSFNFTFDFGAGVELYRSTSRSIRAEYRYHHISNHDTAQQNPGIDNGVFQVTYSFGR